MKHSYSLVEETVSDHDRQRIGYGIAVTDGCQTLAVAHDLSNDKKKIIRLVDLFNELQLSYLHFFDCIEDLIE